jgi:3-oxoacyl-[acyl-carrier protein] reductase
MKENPVALITGGTRGIGLGIARELAQNGLNLALCGRRDPEQVREVCAELETTGVSVLYRSADVSSADSRNMLVQAIQQRFGRLDLLVNNAGMAPRERKDILEATEASYDQVMDVNLKGPYFLTQLVARWMIDQKRAIPSRRPVMINISSISSVVASPSRGDYCLSKAGMSMMTQLWAVRLAEYGILVYELRPGITRTDMTAGVRDTYDARIEQGLLLQPRWGEPADVGRAVAALARGDFAYSTGQCIMIDGGLTVQRL